MPRLPPSNLVSSNLSLQASSFRLQASGFNLQDHVHLPFWTLLSFADSNCWLHPALTLLPLPSMSCLCCASLVCIHCLHPCIHAFSSIIHASMHPLLSSVSST